MQTSRDIAAETRNLGGVKFRNTIVRREKNNFTKHRDLCDYSVIYDGIFDANKCASKDNAISVELMSAHYVICFLDRLK